MPEELSSGPGRLIALVHDGETLLNCAILFHLRHLCHGADPVIHGNQNLGLAFKDEVEGLATFSVLKHIASCLDESVVHLLEDVDA